MIVECGYVRDLAVLVDPGNDSCLAYDEDPVSVVTANPRIFDFVAGSLPTAAVIISGAFTLRVREIAQV
jgi:hypothetical protein